MSIKICCYVITDFLARNFSNWWLICQLGRKVRKSPNQNFNWVYTLAYLGLVTDPVIEAIAWLEFEDGLRMGVHRGGYWYPSCGRI